MKEPDAVTEGFIPPHGGYEDLVAYQKALIVYQVTVRFCERFFKKPDRRPSRTHDPRATSSQGQTESPGPNIIAFVPCIETAARPRSVNFDKSFGLHAGCSCHCWKSLIGIKQHVALAIDGHWPMKLWRELTPR
jgi:hypothetical protein